MLSIEAHCMFSPGPIAGDVSDDQILPLDEVARLLGVSVDTVKRLGADGPVITHVSARHRGVRVKHFRAWLDARAQGGGFGGWDGNAGGYDTAGGFAYSDHGAQVPATHLKSEGN